MGSDSSQASTVTLTAGALASGYTLHILANTPIKQNSVFRGQRDRDAAKDENTHDTCRNVDKRIMRLASGAVRLPETEDPDDYDMVLSAAADRAGKLQAYDSVGNVTFVEQIDGEDIVTGSFVAYVDTIADLKGLAAPSTAVTYFVRGYHSVGDGGGGHFRWNSSDTSTDNGGTILQRTAGGTGRWNRVHNGVIDVRWFGAKGDGTTDDASTLTAVISAAQTNSYSVFLSPGTYFLKSGLTITGGIKIFGYGRASKIKVDGTAARFLPILAQNTSTPIDGLILQDFEVDGGLKGQLDAGLIQLNNCVGFVASGLYIHNGGTPAEASPSGVNGIAVAVSPIGGTGSQGVIRDCLIEACTKAGINWTTEAINGLIVGNIVRSCTGNGLTPGIQVNGGYNGKVVGNSVYDNEGEGIYIAWSGSGGTARAPRNCIVTNNHVYSNGQGSSSGVGIKVANGAGVGTYGEIVISGNVVYSNGVGVNSPGILVQNEDHISLIGNIVHDNSQTGVVVESCNYVLVNDNLIQNNNTSGGGSIAALYLKASTHVNINGNSFVNDGSGTQRWGIQFDPSSGDWVKIFGNYTYGNTAGCVDFSTNAIPKNFDYEHSWNKQTTNATASTPTEGIFLLQDNTAYHARIKVVAMKTDGSDRAFYEVAAIIYRNGGGATIQGGAVTSVLAIESDATWDATLVVSSNSCQVQLTGKAATTIDWKITETIQGVS